MTVIGNAERVIGDLQKAVEELMAEGISKTQAADWGIINSALVNATTFRGTIDPANSTYPNHFFSDGVSPNICNECGEPYEHPSHKKGSGIHE